jgi:hypothetical protein
LIGSSEPTDAMRSVITMSANVEPTAPEDRDELIAKADRKHPLDVTRLSLAAEIAKPRGSV